MCSKFVRASAILSPFILDDVGSPSKPPALWQSRMAEVWKSPIPLAGRLLHPRYYFWYFSYLQRILVQIPELHRYVLSIALSELLATFFLPLFITDLIPCLAGAQPVFNGLGVILFRFRTLSAQCKFGCRIHISRQVPSILRASTSHILFGISELRARTSLFQVGFFLILVAVIRIFTILDLLLFFDRDSGGEVSPQVHGS
jgi:hypothetical protein